MSRFLFVLAVAILALIVVAPVGTMAFRSLRVEYVETVEGRRFEGRIRDRHKKGLVFRDLDEATSRLIPHDQVKEEGRAFSFRHYSRLLCRRTRRARCCSRPSRSRGSRRSWRSASGCPSGLLLAATDVPGRRWLETLLALPLVLPPVLLAIALYRDLLVLRPEFLRAVVVFGLSLFPLVALFTARAVRAGGADALAAARLQTNPRRALMTIALGPALPGALAGALLVFCFVVADFAVPDFLGVTTAKNTIRVYANEVFTLWKNDGDGAAAAAAGMLPTLLALAAFAAVVAVEKRRETRRIDDTGGIVDPVPLGRGRFVGAGFIIVLLLVAVAWPSQRHLETAAGQNYGAPVFMGGAAPAGNLDVSRSKPKSLAEGLRRGLTHERVPENAWRSIWIAGGAALLAVLLAILLTEAGIAWPRLDRTLLLLSFLPLAVPAMSLTVGAVECYGAKQRQRGLVPGPVAGGAAPTVRHVGGP